MKSEGGPAATMSVDGSHGHRHIAEIAALHNALNNNVLCTTTTMQRSIDSILDAMKIRSLSSVGSSSAGSSASNGVKLPVKCDRYKTELCRTYEENGTCRYGDKCQFAHGAAELRTVARHPKYKTDLCRTFHTTGFCPYGSRCHFIHSLQERQLPVQPSGVQVQTANLLLPRLPVHPTKLPSTQMNGCMVADKYSLDNLLHTLSTLLQTNHLGADHVATSLLAQEQAMKLAAPQSTAEFLMQGALPQRLSRVSDATSVSIDSASPCPSPVSLSGAYDDMSFRSCFSVNSGAHISQNTGFQSPSIVHAGILSPPSSPGSAASSLNSASSDYDAYDANWSRSVWPAVLSPTKGVDISLVPDFAQRQLLTAKHSKVFA